MRVDFMNWILQLAAFVFAFGPLVIGAVLWHIVWSRNDGPSSDPPPPDEPRGHPGPPTPRFSGDRRPVCRRPRPSPAPRYERRLA